MELREPFEVIVADPPWSFEDRLEMSDVKRGAAANYTTMATGALCRLQVGDMVAADDAVLLLWCPSALFADGLAVMKRWGFDHRQIWTWAKTRKSGNGLAMGLGHLGRNCTEHALVGVRGHPVRLVKDRSIRNLFMYPALPHSKKPEIVQDAVERMFPGTRRLELFARRDRPGWTCVGNECPSTKGEDVRESLRRLDARPQLGLPGLEV